MRGAAAPSSTRHGCHMRPLFNSAQALQQQRATFMRGAEAPVLAVLSPPSLQPSSGPEFWPCVLRLTVQLALIPIWCIDDLRCVNSISYSSVRHPNRLIYGQFRRAPVFFCTTLPSEPTLNPRPRSITPRHYRSFARCQFADTRIDIPSVRLSQAFVREHLTSPLRC